MKNLIKRYIMNKSRDKIDEGVTEDDINEIKQDVSAFRYELLEVLRNNGMDIPDYGKQGKGKDKLDRTAGTKRCKKRDFSRQLSFGFCVKQEGSRSRVSVLSNQQDSFSSSVDESLPESSTTSDRNHLQVSNHQPSPHNHHNHPSLLVRSKIGQMMMKKFHRRKSRSLDEDDGDVEKLESSTSSCRSRPVSFSLTSQQKSDETADKPFLAETETKLV